MPTAFEEVCHRSCTGTVVFRSSSSGAFASDAEIVMDEGEPDWCLALAEVNVVQVLALRIGELRGRPIDTAPGLKKVTLSA
jgi:hypothetical protein